MGEHRKICPLETIDCEYYKVGCGAKMLCKDLEKHSEDNMKEHLLLTTKKLNSTEDELEIFRERVKVLEIAMQHIITSNSMPQSDKNALWSSHLQLASNIVANTPGERVIPLIIKLSNFTSHKLQKSRVFSVPFYTHKRGYKMCLSVYPNGCRQAEGTHVSVFLHIMKGPYDNQLEWPLEGTFELSLLNQNCDAGHHKLQVSIDRTKKIDRVLSGSRGLGRGNEELNEVIWICQFLNNDCVFFKVAVLSSDQ